MPGNRKYSKAASLYEWAMSLKYIVTPENKIIPTPMNWIQIKVSPRKTIARMLTMTGVIIDIIVIYDAVANASVR